MRGTMERDIQKRRVSEPLLATWIKWTMDFWEAMALMGPGLSRFPETAGASPPAAAEDSWQSTLNLWQAFFSLLSEPKTVDAVFRGINAPSEIILKMARTGWGGYFHLHQQWLEGGERTEAPGFEDLDQESFKAWAEIFEKDFLHLLGGGQAGLVQVSQEKISGAVATFGHLQAAMGEFMYLLHLPLKKSLQVMEKKLEEIAREGELSEDFKDYYKMWLKILEGYYMTLFQSPEYTRTLSHTLEALADFTAAKEDLLADALKALPIPTTRDMDELYLEIHLLKKKVRELSRRMEKLEPSH
jgi:hypothetical protein